MKTKVLLADFQFLTRKGMEALIDATPEMELIEQVENEDQLEEQTRRLSPELVVVDVFEKEHILIPQIENLKKSTNSSFLVISNAQNKEYIQRLLRLGVKGILTKNCCEEEITNGLISVSKGNRFFCNTILEMMMDGESEEENCEPTSLSRREYEVLELITKGKTTALIANRLHLSVHTINSHRKNILKKLKLSSPAELIVYALESGLVKT